MENSDILLLAEALVVRLTIIVGSAGLVLLMFWRIVSMDLAWIQLPVVLAWAKVLETLASHCRQDAKEYYAPRVAEIRRNNDL